MLSGKDALLEEGVFMSGVSDDAEVEEAVRRGIEEMPPPDRTTIQYVPPHVQAIESVDQPGGAAGGAEAVAGPSTGAPPPGQFRPATPSSPGGGPSTAVPVPVHLRPAITPQPMRPPPPVPVSLYRSANEQEMRRPAGRPRFSFLAPVQSIFQNVTLGGVATLVANAGTAAAAGAFGLTNRPVIDWAFAPPFVWAVNDLVGGWRFEAKENPLIFDYYSRSGFTNQLRYTYAAGDNTRTYLNAQVGYDAGLAGIATTSIVLGHFPATAVGSQVLNTALHAFPALTPMIQIGRMLRLRSAYSNHDDFEVWMRWIVGLKTGRVAYRAFLSTLPAYTPAVVLEALAGVGGAALVRNWAIGNYVEAMAQYIHFRAYDEQGWLTRANDCFVDRGPTGRPVLRFEGNARPTLPIYQQNAGPASRTVEALFYDDFRGHITNWRFVGDLLKEPCGWMAIAHKISQL